MALQIRSYAAAATGPLGFADAQTGVNYVRAAGQYYQRILDLAAGQNSRWGFIRTYYDFPYKVHPKLDDVAIVGAGTGNDVAAALRLSRRLDDGKTRERLPAAGTNPGSPPTRLDRARLDQYYFCEV